MKYRINNDEFSALGEDVKKLYTKQDDGSYVLTIEGLEDTGALKRAKDHEKKLRQEAEKLAKEIREQMEAVQAELNELKEGKASKGKDDATVKLEKSWADKLAKREKELNDQLTTVQNALKLQMVDSVASRIATELAGENAEIILPHIQRRLQADIVEGKPVTKVLDLEGSPSALSVEELQKEFLSNQKFSSIIVASKASGGGANGGRKGGGGATKKLGEMSATEEAQFANQNPEQYKQMLAAEQK